MNPRPTISFTGLRAANLRGPNGSTRRVAMCFAAATLFLLILSTAAAAAGKTQPFRVGFSRSLFTNVNDADARAAIKSWSRTVAREHGINVDPSAQLYDRTAGMVAAMRQGAVDAMSMRFDEYFTLSREVHTSHWYVTQTAGKLFEEYILLVHADAGYANLDALKGHALILHDSVRTCLAVEWLDYLVIQQGHAVAADGFFEEIEKVGKVSSAVLPLFFGQAVAAVVAVSSFEMMCELNPQIRLKLRPLVKSRPFVPAVMCFRKDFESPEKKRLLKALSQLHKTPAGQQVLTLFQSEALAQVGEESLADTAAFLGRTRRMRNTLLATDHTAIDLPGTKGDSTHE